MTVSTQRVILKKTATRTSVANSWFSLFDIAGNPGAGTLNAGNTANGIVPVAGGSGYPALVSFGGGAGYFTRVSLASTVACRIRIYDRLFVAGAYAFNANTTLASQPSYSARVPGFYYGTELWVEQVTAATGNQAVNVGYQDQDNNSGSTGAVGIGAAPTVGRCWQLPLASGDSGIQRINSVTGTVATAGTFNVMVLRPLASARINIANMEVIQSMATAGSPRLYETSALFMMVCPDSTSTGLPDAELDVQVVT